IGDAKWFDVFQDDALRELLRAAMAQNYDVQIAAARILEAQAQLGITRADQFPTVSAGAGFIGQHTSGALGVSSATFGASQLAGIASCNAYFWGQYRSATAAARAQLIASDWARRQVLDTLAAEVADAYFTLRALDIELEIATRTLASRQESLRLTELRESGGV